MSRAAMVGLSLLALPVGYLHLVPGTLRSDGRGNGQQALLKVSPRGPLVDTGVGGRWTGQRFTCSHEQRPIRQDQCGELALPTPEGCV